MEASIMFELYAYKNGASIDVKNATRINNQIGGAPREFMFTRESPALAMKFDNSVAKFYYLYVEKSRLFRAEVQANTGNVLHVEQFDTMNKKFVPAASEFALLKDRRARNVPQKPAGERPRNGRTAPSSINFALVDRTFDVINPIATDPGCLEKVFTLLNSHKILNYSPYAPECCELNLSS